MEHGWRDVFQAAFEHARDADRTYVVVIDTDPVAATEAGGAWWDVPVAEVSDSKSVDEASRNYQEKLRDR